MTSLDKLASMEGWDIGEDDTGKSTILGGPPDLELGGLDTVLDNATGATTREPQQEISEVEGESHLGSVAEVYDVSDDDQPGDCRTQQSHSHHDKNNSGGDDVEVSPASDRRHRKRLSSTSSNESRLSRLEILYRERIHTSNAEEKNGACGEDQVSSSKRHTRGRDMFRATASIEPLSCGTAWEFSPRRSSQFLQFLRKRGLNGLGKTGSAYGDNSGTDKAVITKLTSLLREEEEGRERERRAREEAEQEALIAYASLEAESKRAFALENRIRLLTTHQTYLGSGYGGGCSRGVVRRPKDDPKRTRSLSPFKNKTAEAQPAVTMEMVESQAQIGIITDAASAAREEARSAMDTVEGFAFLNRKLMDELRGAINTRNDLLQELDRERCMREELERKFEELLREGLAAALTEKDEMEARYKQAKEEAKRLAALHSRTENEYHSALRSSLQDCLCLQEAVSSLEIQLQDERAERAARRETILSGSRANEEAECANMWFEEVVGVRARLARRAKRREYGTMVGLRSKMGEKTAYGGGNSGGGYDGGKLEIRHGRSEEIRQIMAIRVPISMTGDRKQQATSKNRDTCGDHSNRSSPRTGAIPSVLQRRATRGNSGADTDGSLLRERQHGDERTFGDVHVNSLSSVGIGISSGEDREGVELAVESAAVERVKAFLGDALLSLKRPASVRGVSGMKKKCDEGRDEEWKSAALRCEVFGQSREISVKANRTIAEQKQGEKIVEANASARSHSLINGLARMLSSSWLYILTRAATGSTKSGVGASGGEGVDSSLVDTCANASVPRALIRHMVQTCGLVRSTGSGPTMAQLDMRLERLAAGEDRLGHRKYFDLVLSLAEARFAGEPKDCALDQLSRILHPLTREVNFGPYAEHRKVPTSPKESSTGAGPGVSRSAIRGKNEATTSLKGTGFDEAFAGAERVLGKNSRALEKIYANYSIGFFYATDAPGVRMQQLLPFASLMSFCKDFELVPGLISHETAHRVYVHLVYPLETYLTPKMLAAKEGSQERRGCVEKAGGGSGFSVGATAEGFGLETQKWMAWLGLAAVRCTWFDKQRGLYNTPEKKMLGLLQWMDGSAGRARMGSRRGTTVVPSFNLTLPTGGSRTAR